MKVSVIMLTYNRAHYLEKAVNSVLVQTMKDFELLIIDNGSTDTTREICDRLKQQDQRIKVCHIEKSRIGAGRNIGLAYAKGQYVTFVDDDDDVSEDYLAYLIGLAQRHEAEVAICGVYRDEAKKKSLEDESLMVMGPDEAIITMMWRKVYSTGFPAKLMVRELFDKHRFSESDQYEDIGLMYKVLADASKVVASNLPKYHVVRHETNHSAITEKDSMITKAYINDYRRLYRTRTMWLCEKFPKQKEYWWYFDWSFQISMIHKIVSNDLMECSEHLEEMKREIKRNKEVFINSIHILSYEKSWVEEYIY